ncbi:MAG TPA: 3-deoxy-7-phosphoheptulonate synthase [Candidatus Hydrogenedentes bacterium]|jgi:3-deoxy-7-phosphoheptulonate synthase|nr:MAG: Phospho-2-dehydro-3-deoxyheptonate aldolase, Tyr-sensitive [Candidatus Hydrogenedentes bacterium ADurb.Bin170]HOD94268.1 3-deoxy-7-phosphoheptulonate synthase [Candidatus Hydrogenedentota bacterium]HOH42130.1 3-deoxy-7-phosphoheptulonate synthase [Candidatus Hydrogenedentota bacterium]HOR50614.1 3-deoxy-7-phosphoheptulonate synthase [Candidatus Hydrogenedentota bacterium]HPX85231.1 3-deoxy-7-phosphoheptulonate synthase [Candidatus Hydrogenedentota bacterium]
MQRAVENVNVLSLTPLPPPDELKAQFPLTENTADTVANCREQLAAILDGKDRRFLVITGPCSIHDTEAGLDYARRLHALSRELSDRLFILMRVYYEKPRTTVGWKGLINDPDMNNSYDIQKGLRKARRFLLDVAEMGLGAASEVLDPIIPQYLADLMSWVSIGARTSESQTHREMASGLSMPVGFKNNTSGNLQSAIDALIAAGRPHHFLGVDGAGRSCVVHTRGNSYGHVILRGGRSGPNYDPVSVITVEDQMRSAGLEPRIIVDCSHANCGKRPRLQAHVLRDVIQQRLEGNKSIYGVMLESNLQEGNQKLSGNASDLRYGCSVTDPCIDWEMTEQLLREAHRKLA